MPEPRTNGHVPAAPRPEGRFRGVFAIPPTPFDDLTGAVDEVSLRRCVEFCVAAGAHGIVAPVNASESTALTDAERLRVTEVLVEQAAGRVPVFRTLSVQVAV